MGKGQLRITLYDARDHFHIGTSIYNVHGLNVISDHQCFNNNHDNLVKGLNVGSPASLSSSDWLSDILFPYSLLVCIGSNHYTNVVLITDNKI